MFDLNDARFKPLWLRVMLVAICFGWAAFEFVSRSPGWAAIFAAIGAWAVWGFFINFHPDGKNAPE
ncbi:DUF3329 domain-containing protein [Ochrobactrum chromiisoli]|uniref:DUF3329 domain-containing protein n=1 Tax=Ochrobactrum chromiisoli TaxID=2993941 RepID=A0ABT3QTT7_9HYPH|nr:DUF3329 domain-containing protein [Ochrobactrum chromiisoli]MCX2699041.1 DUF3329 domain-containing protein [Ochrobactrum chromiisoli]